MKKAILLDWDGVLCDSLALYVDLYQEACRRHGKTYPAHDLESFKGWYNPRWEENYYEMGFSEEEFRSVLVFSQDYLDYARAPLFEGMPEMLRNLARDFPLAICSTTPSEMIRARLRLEGLEELFSHFTGGEDGVSEKLEKVAQTLAALGATAGVMVGDTPLDIVSGRANGLATIGVTYGWVTAQRVRDAEPTSLVEAPENLEPAIRQLMG